MAKYRFFRTADNRQDEIWDYTLENWGEKQAEKYTTELHQHLAKLSENKLLWRSLPGNLAVPDDLEIPVYFSHFKHHYIFFRELSGRVIGIMTILHDSMDIPVRLGEDLLRIEEHYDNNNQ
ncbi:MAG: type II toxin-antitoxin system RelE/ParE family toxin [Gammaproteobacteria bacterium]|nr:type II toxin-antitoxin system RelE/ParE family toxin [Gammaproteobacteria bacterium]